MQSIIKHSRISFFSVAVFILALVALPAGHAANIWVGAAGDGNWNSSANWDNGAVPATAQPLTFSGNVQTITSNNIGSFTAASFLFTNDGTSGKTSSFTLGGPNGVASSGAFAITTTSVTGATITDTISLNLTLNHNLTVSTAASHNLIVSGAILNGTGTRNLSKTGSGELTLTSAGNTYGGATSINQGILTVDVAGGIANQGVASALGRQTTAANSQLNFNGGTLNVKSGANSTDRQIRIGSDTSAATGGATIANNSANGSTPLVFTTAAFNNTTDTGMNAVTAARTLTLGGANTDANAVNGFIADHNTVGGGIVRVNKADAGRWILSGANTYTGSTTLSAGTLQIGVDSVGSVGAITSSAIGRGGLSLNGGLLSSSSGAGRSLLNATTVGGNVTLGDAVNNGSLNFNAAVNLGGTIRTLTTASDVTFQGVVSNGGINKAGASNLTLGGANTYSGLTTINAGTLTVAGSITSSSVVNGGLLTVNGTAGDVTVNNGGSLGGSGTVGAVTLTSGSFLKPGNSPGLLSAAPSSWAAGSTYNWEIDQASGGEAGVNWDLFSVTGALDLSALSSTATMNLVLQSLPAMDDFSTTTPYSWVFAQAGSLIGDGLTDGADVTALFNINATAFNGGNLPTNGFKVEVGTDANNLRTLNLMAIPEPSTGSMLGFGLGGLVLTRLLRRKQIRTNCT